MKSVADDRPLFGEVEEERLGAHLDWCSRVRRDTGGPGEDAMVDYIVDQLQRDGVPVEVHEFDAFLSYPRRATLEILAPEPRQFACLTHSFVRSTGPAGVVGSVKYLPDADVSQGSGRVVLLDGLASPIKVLQASRAAATAVVFANADWYVHNMIATTIWGGAPTLDQVDRLPSVPVVSISHEDGAAIKELLGRGPVEARVVTEVDTGWYRVRLPEVIVPGTGPTEEFVLVGGHYCSWEYGSTDNSTGVADILELARIFWKNRGQLRRPVRFVWWPGHSHGRYAGSTWYADTFFEQLSRNCILYHNIDSPGVRGATKYILRHTSAEVEDFGREVIETRTQERNPDVHRPARSADQSFLAIGVPTCSIYSFLPDGHPDRKAWTGGSANAWWWHTEHDTRDKADTSILAKDVGLSVALIQGFANADLFPLRLDRVGSEYRRFIESLGEEVRDQIDLAPSIMKTVALEAALSRWQEHVGGAEAGDPAASNRVLMRLTRLLNPVVFTSLDRFSHEAADMTPLMRASTTSQFPGLSKATGLSSLAGRREHGFLMTQIRRQVNRFDDACDRAIEEIERALES